MKLPSGDDISYEYGTSDANNPASLLTTVKDDLDVTIATYYYLGASRVLQTTYNQPGIYSAVWSFPASFPGLDRFNRVTTSSWTSDLATDVDFVDLDISYDRNSNVTLVEDNIHSGWDVSYTMDDLDRLVDAQQGTWGGSSIGSEVREEEWTLGHTGNWDFYQLDLTDDGDGLDTDEFEDDRTHNKVNELTARDTDDDGTDDYDLVYDAVGNLTDDDEAYEYEYDPFGRLWEITDQSANTVAEYEYNGMGHMIRIHLDTDDDGDVDGDDVWFNAAYDERWRMVSYFREDDTYPKEEFVPEQAGFDGAGGSSYINGVICRNKDNTTDWDEESDSGREQRMYYCQNWRGDVVSLIHYLRLQSEEVRYSPYGEPYGMPMPDTDSDGDRDATDYAQIGTWASSGPYDPRGDVNLDGAIDATDQAYCAAYGAETLGWGALSWIGNRRGYGMYERVCGDAPMYLARHRVLQSVTGKWLRRDPLGYVDGANLYEYTNGGPMGAVEAFGLTPLMSGSMTPAVDLVEYWRTPLHWGASHGVTSDSPIDQQRAEIKSECRSSVSAGDPGDFPFPHSGGTIHWGGGWRPPYTKDGITHYICGTHSSWVSSNHVVSVDAVGQSPADCTVKAAEQLNEWIKVHALMQHKMKCALECRTMMNELYECPSAIEYQNPANVHFETPIGSDEWWTCGASYVGNYRLVCYDC